MKREVFHHAAYEAYPDLLAAACKEVASRGNMLVGWVEVHP